MENSDVTKLTILSENKVIPCTLYFSRQAGHSGTVSNKDCNKNPSMPNLLTIGKTFMVAHYVRWFNKIRKSRKFTCHADIPGVGGGEMSHTEVF